MQRAAMAVAGIALAMLATAALAQERFPERSIQMIVPATPGGPVDTAARMIEPALASALSASLVLVNRPGASGTLGMQEVATAEPNGYTIGQGINSIFTVTRISGTTVPFTLDSFTLLGNYATDISVLAVSADAPWKTLDDVIAYVHANPGKLNYRFGRNRHRVVTEHAGAGPSIPNGHGRGAVCRRSATHHRHSG
jgi:tripartite-type tricarboxylate transporter receptor subunit TctC